MRTLGRVNWRASSVHTAIAGLANTLVQLASAFGVHLTASQDVAITAAVNGALVLVSALVVSSTNGHAAASPSAH